MRLINTATLRLHEFIGCPPPYAILSHVTDGDQTLLNDLAQVEKDTSKESLKVIQRACEKALAEGSEWLWNYAACVDKRSSAAQSEAINSLAQIHRDCEYILIYLEDLECKLIGDESIAERLAESRWFKNIWAIPQIIFPRAAYFYSSEWNQIGTKKSLLAHLSAFIGIDQPVLEDSDCLEDYSIARRMSWASDKTALPVEDSAYALLGLFDVSMPIIYGEGPKAFLRLQEEIMRDTDDFSLITWDSRDGQEYNGLFACSPACFRRFRNGPTTPHRMNGEAQIHCTGITIEASFLVTQSGLVLPLEGQDGLTCCLPLFQWNGRFVRWGSEVKSIHLGQMALESRRVFIKRDVSAHLSRKISSYRGYVRDCSFGPLDESGTARPSRSSVMDYSSNDGTGRTAPSVEDCGLTSQYAPSTSFSGLTSQEDQMAWSTHERGSVDGILSELERDVTPSWLHEIASEAHHRPEGYHVDEPSQDSVDHDGQPSTEAQILDVVQITEELADVAIEEFEGCLQRQSKKRCFIPWQAQNRKRPKLMQQPSDQREVVDTSDSDDGETVLVKKTRLFACPFYVRSNTYTKCITRHHFKSIDEVKEHLCWEHRRPMFCPVCKDEFPSSRDRDAHIRLRICRANNKSPPEGITDCQDEQLNSDEESPLSEDSRWFQIWDITFPNTERPFSTFYTGEREVSVSTFRQFWMQDGQEIVSDFLERKKCQSYNIQNEERKLQAIYDGVMEMVVDRIFDNLSDPTGTA